jgi:hypothetical protein
LTAGLRAALVAAGAASVSIAVASAPAAERLTLTGEPALFPSFRADVSDYVSRCGRTGSLRLSGDAPAGTTVSVDGGPARTGPFAETIRLGAGQAVGVAVRSANRVADYRVRCLPEDFPRWAVERNGRTQARWYLVPPSEHYAAFFDPHGVPVWWRHSKHVVFNPTLLPDGHVAWYDLPKAKWFKFGLVPDAHYEERRLDGSLVRKLRTVGTPTDLHEIQRLANGDFMLDSYRAVDGVDLRRFGGPRRARVFFGEAQEVTPAGKLVWRWSSRDHVSLAETADWWPRIVKDQRKVPERKRLYDAFHINGIAPAGDDFVISGRHTNAVYRVDRNTGRVEWKLGGTHTKESLRIVGDPRYGSTTFGGQHDPRVLPDGTLTVFDNGAGRDRPPRVVRYRIDPVARTATLLEELTDPRVPLAGWGGGTRRLRGGNWVTAWGGSPFVTEITPAGRVVLRLSFESASLYRAFPVPRRALPAHTLRAAMDRMFPR